MNQKTRLDKMNYKQDWDTHWESLSNDSSVFSKILTFYRINIISRAVNHYFEHFFKEKGTFVECGSGTSQDVLKVNKKRRKLIALDISKKALEEASKIRKIDKCIQGDIFDLPFKDNSIDGIWNLGVMEHFSKKQIIMIFNEFFRVLKKGGRVIIFWPPVFGSSELVLGLIESIIHIFKKNFYFFPNEITRLKSKKHARDIISKTKFKLKGIHFNYLDLFTHIVILLEK